MAYKIYATENYGYGKFSDLSHGEKPETTGGIQRQEWKWDGGLHTRYVQRNGRHEIKTQWEVVGRGTGYDEQAEWAYIEKNRERINA